MPSLGLFFSPRARRDLKAIPRRDQVNILSDIESLAGSAHFPGPPKVKKLEGAKDLYRLRTGDYRSIFRIGHDGLYILRIVPRKELDRSLSRIWG